MGESLKSACDRFRDEIGELAKNVKNLINHEDFKNECAVGEDRNEMKANIMLCYRHLEDARMRVGKILQAQDGGTSIYDKK